MTPANTTAVAQRRNALVSSDIGELGQHNQTPVHVSVNPVSSHLAPHPPTQAPPDRGYRYLLPVLVCVIIAMPLVAFLIGAATVPKPPPPIIVNPPPRIPDNPSCLAFCGK